MSEADAGSCPQVFVVDSQVSHIIPTEKKPRWPREGSKFLLLLMGFSMLGIVIEGCFIYNLYQKTEAFNQCASYPLCHNLSNAAPFAGEKDGTLSKQVGHREIPSLQTQTQRRPFAHLLGLSLSHVIKHGDVIQWATSGESIIQNMTYHEGLLVIQQPGYYYLYSKLQLNSFANCTHTVTHMVTRNTSAYGIPMDLMKSKYNCCRTTKENAKCSERVDLWNSFLAGIFELQKGDRIFVKLDKIQAMRQGHTENFLGAFMVSP